MAIPIGSGGHWLSVFVNYDLRPRKIADNKPGTTHIIGNDITRPGRCPIGNHPGNMKPPRFKYIGQHRGKVIHPILQMTNDSDRLKRGIIRQRHDALAVAPAAGEHPHGKHPHQNPCHPLPFHHRHSGARRAASAAGQKCTGVRRRAFSNFPLRGAQQASHFAHHTAQIARLIAEYIGLPQHQPRQ